jgi:hypothetical protein
VTVDYKATTDHERAKTGGDDRARASEPKPGPPLQARHLAVRDDVAEVRRELHAECDRQPDRIDVPQFVEHVAESGSPGNTHERSERQHAADADEQGMLRGPPIQMWQRPKEVS